MIKSITIRPLKDMRYDTLGDWTVDDEDNLEITVQCSNDTMGREHLAIAIHELVEALLCLRSGISQKEVDDWDMNNKLFGEPGEHPNCPYVLEHSVAACIEKIFAHELGLLNWEC